MIFSSLAAGKKMKEVSFRFLLLAKQDALVLRG